MNSVISKAKRVIVGKVLPEEDLIDKIREMVHKFEIKSGLVNVIGAFKKFTLGYYDIPKKDYLFKTFEENVELVSCMGNIAHKDGEPIIHLHAMVGRPDYSIIGGHLDQPSIVSVTGEVYIYEIDKVLERKKDPQFDLSLLDI